MLGFIWKDGKPFVFLTVLLAIFNSFFILVYTIFPGLLINELTENRDIIKVIVYACIVVFMPFFQYLVNTIITRITTKQRFFLKTTIIEKFYVHTSRMDYEYIENPEIQVKQRRALDALDSSFGVVTNLSGLLSAFLNFVTIFSLILTLNPLIILVIVAVVYFNSIITKRINERTHKINKEIDQNGNKLWAATFMLEHIHFAKEIRIFNLSDMLIDYYDKVIGVSNKLNYQLHKDNGNFGLLQTAANLLKDVIIYAYLIWQVLAKGLGIGSMTIYISAVNQFTSSLSGLVSTYLNLANSSIRIQELIDFMNLPLRQYESGNALPTFDNNSVIEFKNVSFRYPGSDRLVINNLNLRLHSHEKLCIVGENGAGKSTFIKLLTRLYFPTEGGIFLDGRPINDYSFEAYQKLFAPVFQDFAKFYVTLGENIVLNDKFDQTRLDAACESSGLSNLVEKLPNGYKTQVDKSIDPEGIEPSGGEAQKIAIARALYHGGEIYILDEPTAALDPNAEYEIYTQFHNMIKDQTAILVTHRLSAVQLADKVAVFDDGQIIEYGTHSELYAKGGKYKEMFDKQSEFYVKAANETEQQNNS